MKKINSQLLTYKKYLESLDKKSINKIIDLYHLEAKKNQKKEKCIEIILDNVHHIAEYTLSLFQQDEFINLKLLLKKRVLQVRINHLLKNFLENMANNFLVVKQDENEYYIPDELLIAYKVKVKKIDSVIKSNTNEYNLILGFVDAYGVVDFDYFYFNYSKDYKLSKEDAMKRLENLSKFFKEFKLYGTTKKYIASKTIKNVTECNNYAKRLGNYSVYTNDELRDIHTLKMLSKNKAYKKLVRFITHNYNVSKGNMKIVNKFVIMPYFTENQKDSDKAEALLSSLIDKYFEYNDEKHKNKFVDLVKENAKDFPRWSHKGSLERMNYGE